MKKKIVICLIVWLAILLMCMFSGCNTTGLKLRPVKDTPLFQVRERGHSSRYGGTLSPYEYWYEDNYNRYHRDDSRGGRK